jgi:hypothetical protein
MCIVYNTQNIKEKIDKNFRLPPDVCTKKKLSFGFGYWVGYYIQNLNPKPKNFNTQTQNLKILIPKTGYYTQNLNTKPKNFNTQTQNLNPKPKNTYTQTQNLNLRN